jgi:subfamily B ATP-binding cassette protein MsbA
MIETVSNTSIVFIQKFLIDHVFTERNYSILPLLIALFIAAGFISALMFTLTSRCLVTGEFRISHSLLRRMLGSMEHVPIERFQQERHGKYVYKLTSDLFSAGSFIGWQLPRGLQEILNLCILIGVIGWASPVLLLLLTGMCTMYVAVGYYFVPRLKAASREVSERRSALLIQIEEGVASTREVIAYHRLKWEDALYNNMFRQYFEKVMDEGKLVNRQMRYSDPMKWCMGILVLGYGGYQLMNGRMSPGTFVLVFQFATQMAESFYNLFQLVMNVSSNLAYIDRVRDIIDIERQKPGERTFPGKVERIAFDKVGFRYADDLPQVIREFSAELDVGKKIAIVGSSGGGKSTITQLISRFYDPQHGAIRINGIPLIEVRRDVWTERLAVVFQDPYMFPDTIRENLLVGRNALTDEEMMEACKIAQIHDFIMELPNGYETDIGERGIKLSGGQRQRIAIARAILGDPEILVLDEATSALDLETERLLLSRLDQRRAGLTTIMIAHRLSTIENAHIILVMDQGMLADNGRHQELLDRPDSVYGKLLLAQQS